MILSAEQPATNLYRVEVSGWDDNKAFFVENSELEWTEESGKQVTLSRGLANGAVIFLRLLHANQHGPIQSRSVRSGFGGKDGGRSAAVPAAACIFASRVPRGTFPVESQGWGGKGAEMEQRSEMVASPERC
jgi:hypothetical protein